MKITIDLFEAQLCEDDQGVIVKFLLVSRMPITASQVRKIQAHFGWAPVKSTPRGFHSHSIDDNNIWQTTWSATPYKRIANKYTSPPTPDRRVLSYIDVI